MDNNNKKLDKIQEDIGEIKTHLAVYNEQLKIHIKRSTLLEEKIQPIEKHVNMVSGAIKLLTLLGGIAVAIAAVLALK